MEKFWTSNKSIKGLRHFVLVNKEKENDKIVFLMVSVLDAEVNFKVTQKELLNNSNWKRGWLVLVMWRSRKSEAVPCSLRSLTPEIAREDRLYHLPDPHLAQKEGS